VGNGKADAKTRSAGKRSFMGVMSPSISSMYVAKSAATLASIMAQYNGYDFSFAFVLCGAFG
jgi:hypothetical protein